MKDQRRTKAQLEAMQRQSEGFRCLVENSPDIIFRLSLLPAPHFDYLSLKTITVSMRNAVQVGPIVNELISNAFKHAFPADFQSEPSIEIWLRSTATGIETTVTDNGIGLPMGFSLQDPASLGLQVVCSLTEQLGGEVQFTSTAGIGTSFIVTLPSTSLDLAETCLHTPKPAIGQEELSR